MQNPYLNLKKSKEDWTSSSGRREGTPKNALSSSLLLSSSTTMPFTASTKRPLVTPTSDKTTKIAAPTVSNSSASALIISASAKAGMEGIDRAKIDAIILRESGDSKYIQQQRRRDEKVNQRIQAHQTKLQQANPKDYAITQSLEERLRQWQSSQATRATCVVVDMDMFYFACEALNKPHLKGVPACVGRGMILTSNYPARRFGVRSAMPGWIGDKLVEELSQGRQRLVHVPSNFELYKEKSTQVVRAMKEFDPQLKAYSLDEAYLDLGPYLALYLQQTKEEKGDTKAVSLCDWNHEAIVTKLKERQEAIPSREYGPVLRTVSNHTCKLALELIVRFMRSRVEEATGGLTCSAGMAPNFSLAKIASDFNKPNGQCFVDPSQVLDFVRPLPVRKIPGIGRVTEKVLNACQINTVQDLYDQRGLVNWMFQPATREFLLKASIGCMGSNSNEDLEDEEGGTTNDHDHQKGISRERTFQATDCWNALNNKLQDVAEMLSQDMVRKKVLSHTVTVKVTLDSFDVYNRSKSLKRGLYIQKCQELLAVVMPLLAQVRSEHYARQKDGRQSFSCRLLGIRCSNLIEEEEYSSSQQETIERFLSNSPPALLSKTYSARAFGRIEVKRAPTGPQQKKILDFPTRENDKISERRDFSALHQVSTNTTTSEPGVACPLCQKHFPATENVALNEHVDSCLSGTVVRQAVRESSTTSDKRPAKRQRLTDWWVK